MVTLTVPFRLAESNDGSRTSRAVPTTVAVAPGSWEAVVQGIRDQNPTLANRVLTAGGTLASGFALVLNDEVVHGGNFPSQLHPGDELFVIATMAGG